MKVVKTPLRVSLFGGGTDFPEYFSNNKTTIIGSTIDKYIYVTFNKNTKLSKTKYQIFYKNNEFVNNVSDIKHKVIKQALKKYYKYDDNIEMHIAADLPGFSGLGSSSTFSTSIINLLSNICGTRMSKKKLANEVINFERVLLQDCVGYQDQIHSVYGGFNFIELYKKEFKIIKYNNKKFINKLNKNLFLVFTGRTRSAAKIEKKKLKQIKLNKNYFDKIKEISYEAKKIFSEKYNINKIGTLLDYSWDCKKKLADNVTNNFFDGMYRYAKKYGSTGGKLLGAGAGGFFLFYVPKQNQKKFIKKINSKYQIIDFKFSEEGTKILNV
ncbi:putative kinase, galactokinase/mevalonate kinase [alpha proteobacterium HIMB114]|nr:putative kinase, galactokinase/mevalonate kinase [alpha proteobacterium HIMB114]